jgi:YidC/Oxa1 family membrane protein insertase
MQKMQALAPELKALNEKYKDDRQALAAAQMELCRKHGVNPFGTCWVLLLQLPIFMGLWYALQESIFFRLAPFWPTWIENLAAPDMLFGWGRGIPVISADSSYGGWLYLGPYLNILPIIAIALMLVQQKMMTPPPTNEQEEANQRVMTIMMVVMGLLFYKVAAGLCIYFIATSLWGVAERQFLPKPVKPGERPAETPPPTPAIQYAGATAGGTGSTAVTPATPSTPPSQENRGRSKKGKKGRRAEQKTTQKTTPATPEPEAEPTTMLGKMASWWRKRRKALAEWWAEVLRQAEKK